MVFLLVARRRRSVARAVIVGVSDVIVFLIVINHLVYVADFLVHIFVIQVTALDAVVVQQFAAVIIVVV